MDFHNVSAIIQDEIIELIENLDLNDPRVQSFLVQLDSIEIFDKRKLKNHSKSFVFFLSKSYYNSELFKSNWQEAKETKKDIFLLILEPCFDFSSLEHDQTKIFKEYEGDYYKNKLIDEIQNLLNIN